MKLKVKIATAAALALYVTMFLYLISPDWVLANITLLRVLGWTAAIAIAGYAAIGNLHNWLDRNWFYERERVDVFIRERLTNPCTDTLCPRAVKSGILDAERTALINLFYTFIPHEDTERERAFSYFGDYFTTVNLTAISLLGMIGAAVFAVIVPLERTEQRLMFGVLALLCPALFSGLRFLTKRRLSLPAEAQTSRILAIDLEPLKERLPHYRVYDANLSCKDSGRCPLVTTRS